MLFLYYIKKGEDLCEISGSGEFHFQNVPGGFRLRRLFGDFFDLCAAAETVRQGEEIRGGEGEGIDRSRPRGSGEGGRRVVPRGEGSGPLLRPPGSAAEEDGKGKEDDRRRGEERRLPVPGQ